MKRRFDVVSTLVRTPYVEGPEPEPEPEPELRGSIVYVNRRRRSAREDQTVNLRERLEQLGLTPNQVAAALQQDAGAVEHLLAKVSSRSDITNRAAYFVASLRSLPVVQAATTTNNGDEQPHFPDFPAEVWVVAHPDGTQATRIGHFTEAEAEAERQRLPNTEESASFPRPNPCRSEPTPPRASASRPCAGWERADRICDSCEATFHSCSQRRPVLRAGVSAGRVSEANRGGVGSQREPSAHRHPARFRFSPRTKYLA